MTWSKVVMTAVALAIVPAALGDITTTEEPTQFWTLKCVGNTLHLERYVIRKTISTVTLTYPPSSLQGFSVPFTYTSSLTISDEEVPKDVTDTGVPCQPDDPSSTGTLPNLMQELHRRAEAPPVYYSLPHPIFIPFAVEDSAQAQDLAPRGRPQAASPSGSSAFVATVPYHKFGMPLLTLGSQPSPAGTQCSSQLNPTAFLVNHTSSVVTRNNLCTGAVAATIPVSDGPLQVGVTPDGKWGIVTSYYNAISFINTDSNTVANVIQTDSGTFPAGLAIAPDGSYALVTSIIDVAPALLILDLQKQAIAGRIPLDQQFPQSVFLNPDATLAWVTYPYEDSVEVIDILTGVVDQTIQVPQPIAIVFNQTGTVAYISSLAQGGVLAVDTKTYATIANPLTGAGAGDMLLSPDGTVLVVNNYNGNSESFLDTSSQKVPVTNPVTGPPRGSVLVPIQ